MVITSRERILNTLEYEEIEYIPCSFMLFFNLYEKCHSQKESIERELELGLDAFVNVGRLKHSFHPDVKCIEWIEKKDEELFFYRRLETPEGPLTQKVQQRHKWPTCEDFPLLDDRIVSRAEEVLVKPEADLEKLKYIFGPPRKEDLEKLKEESKTSKMIARKNGLLQVAGCMGWRDPNADYSRYKIAGADIISWLSGYEDIMVLSLLRPDLIKEYLDIIGDWNIKQIEIYLDITDADLIIRRAWYETVEFWTPEAYKNLILPTVKREADLVHQAGKKYGYIITSAFMPIIDHIIESGVDILIGVDPKEGKGTDMALMKEKFLSNKKALWGGVSGSLTIENDDEEKTEQAVIEALKLLGKGGGFILSPVDNVRENTKNAWNNTYKMISTWKKYRKSVL